MGRDLAMEAPATSDAQAAALQLPHMPMTEAKTAFQSMGQACGNDAARAALPACHIDGGEQGATVKTASALGEKTPIEEKGWSKIGGGRYVKDFPLPKDWEHMSVDEQNNWLHGVMEQAEQDAKGFKGNEAPMGGRVDPLTGEHIWTGWAGDAPSKEEQQWLKQGPRSGV